MFLDPGAFPFLADLEASWRDIRDECAALPPDAFDPWVQRDMYGAGWDVYGLVAFGYDIREALARCPRTAAAIAKIPHLTTAGFSRLAPGAHIEPHVGWVKTVYRAHLGLVVPSSAEDCALRVGDVVRPWREGVAVVFDDTAEHEAWNRTASTRTVLLFDFARPGCEDAPQDEPPPAVRAMLRARVKP
ncbi:MAG: aspartyl/asparaginyl beta-hydroxylase domain-containing protein [Myxococcaceae bacterium]|nr:aspartyl/asparaginyl beta-hydroxylase domain-containing protein [Myxococcaceae bacterium]